MGGFVANALESVGRKLVGKAMSSGPLGESLVKAGISAESGLEKLAGTEGVQGLELIKAAKATHERLAAPIFNNAKSAIGDLADTQWQDAINQQKTGAITTPEAAISKRAKDTVYSMFQNRGLAKGYTQDYYPRMMKENLFSNPNPSDAVEFLLKTGRAPDSAAARKMLSNGFDTGSIAKEDAIKHLLSTGQATSTRDAESLLGHITEGGRVFSNIEKRRLANLPEHFWRTDKAVDYDYIWRGTKRIAEHDTLGPKDEVINDILDKIKAEHGQQAYDYAAFVYEHQLGRRIGEQGPMPGLSRRGAEGALSSMQAIAHLGFIPFSIAMHSGNIPVAVRGISPIIRGIGKIMADSGDAMKFAQETTPIIREFYNAARNDALGKWSAGQKFLQYNMGQATGRWVRVLASVAGKDAAETSFGKLLKDPADAEAKNLLQILGVDVNGALQRGALDPSDVASAARRVNDIAIYNHSGADLPPSWTASPWGRLVTMFKGYPYYESKFVKDHIIMPALRGDMKPLAYAAIVFPTVAEVMTDMRELIRKGNLKDRPDWNRYPADRIVDDVAHTGAMGLAYDAMRAMSYNDRSAAWSTLAGPVLSDVVDTSYDLFHNFDPSKPHPLDDLGKAAKKDLARNTPIIGPRLYEAYFRNRGVTQQKGFLQKGGVTKTFRRLSKVSD